MDSRTDDPLQSFGLSGEGDEWLARLRVAEERGAPRRAGAWRLLAAIEGGQGVVYRATRDDGSPDAALKRLADGIFATEVARRRFEREVGAMQRLEHPNIVRVRGVEDVEGHLVLVMDWIDGLPLHRYVERAFPGRDPAAIADLFIELCGAVQHAHERGVVHRDLKPGNVIVDRGGRPRLLDFGLARSVEPETSSAERGPADRVTRAGQFVGTPAYAAPEQSAGDASADVRSDVWSLGVMLFEMLSGELPFERGGEVRLLSTVRPGVDPALERVLDQALRTDRLQRYAGAGALADDLARWRRGEPIAADAIGAARRLKRMVRRHRLLAAALAVIALAAAGWGHLASRHRAELEAKQEQLEAALLAATQGRSQATQTLVFFIHDLLDRADPLYSPAGFTVRDALLATERRLDTLSSYTPTSRMILRESLGAIWMALDELEKADVHLREALALDIATFGDKPPFSLARKSEVARGLLLRGRLDEADALMSGAADTIAGRIDAPAPFVASLIETRGRLERAHGDAAAAAATLAVALERIASYGPPAPWWDDIRRERALALLDAGRPADAAAEIDTALEERELGEGQAIAREYPRARLLTARSMLLRRGGDLEGAEDAAREAVSTLRQRLAPEHSHLLEAELELATVRLERGAVAEAESLAEGVAARLRPERLYAGRALVALRDAIAAAKRESPPR